MKKDVTRDVAIWRESCVNYEDGKCRVVVEKKCTAESKECPFHMTRAQKQASLAKHDARMNAMPEESQRYYAEKYYGGKMPWKDGTVCRT